MRSAAKKTISCFSFIMAFAGLEHGVGEVLQGSVKPDGWMIQSWTIPSFQILAGEPAMTIIPNLLASGILTILFSLVFLTWANLFVHRKHGSMILILLSIIMLLVGGGFGPPFLGIILGAAATQLNHARTIRRDGAPHGFRRLLGSWWSWLLAIAIFSWLMMFPGVIILDHLIGVNDPYLLIAAIFITALGSLLLAIFAGYARDSLALTTLDHAYSAQAKSG